MVIDFHVHAFQEKIAGKALHNLSRCSGNLKPAYDGTAPGLRRYLSENGLDFGVVQNIAVTPHQQRAVNDFAAENDHGNLICFGSIHPEAPDWREELDRICSLGLRGIKLHPDYQKFFADDPHVFPVYEAIAARGLITLFHCGMDIGLFEPVHCAPKALRAALPAFSGAPVVAAHMGGWLQWNEAEKELTGQPVYLDTAFSYGRMPPLQAQRMIEAHGADHFLFGSDMPWSSSVDEREFIRSLALSAADEEKILGGNAARLLKL